MQDDPGGVMVFNTTFNIISVISRQSVLVEESGVPGVSKWAGTRYFYPPEIVYSTGRNY